MSRSVILTLALLGAIGATVSCGSESPSASSRGAANNNGYDGRANRAAQGYNIGPVGPFPGSRSASQSATPAPGATSNNGATGHP